MASETTATGKVKGFGQPGEVPGWVNYALLPLLNLVAALLVSSLVILAIGENPDCRDASAALRLVRLSRGDRLHTLLLDQLHLHRSGGRGGVPLRPVQHRRRGAGLYRRAGDRLGGALSRLAAVAADRDPRHRGGCRRRCRLGLHSGISSGATRQPHRHHDYYVQLHRSLDHDVAAGRRADSAGPAIP